MNYEERQEIKRILSEQGVILEDEDLDEIIEEILEEGAAATIANVIEGLALVYALVGG